MTVYVVAEIGANHQGDLSLAHELVDQCAWAGVDCVKGQKRCLDEGVLFSRAELDRPYTSEHAFGPTYGEHRAALELDWDEHRELHAHARHRGLDYTVSVWDPVSASQFPREWSWVKVPSACATWPALQTAVNEIGVPITVSTGGLDWYECQALGYGRVGHGPQRGVTLMQCTSAYPTQPADVQLRSIASLWQIVPRVGLSGHHRGIAIDMAAVAMGADVIERHVTLDRTWKGTDHAASLEPAELHALVRGIREVEAALGSGPKRVLDVERSALDKLRTEAMRAT